MPKKKSKNKKYERELEREPLTEEEFPGRLSRISALKKLERKIVRQNKTKGTEIDESDREVSEDPREVNEGLGIEKDEESGQEAYPEIEKAEKDPEEEEED